MSALLRWALVFLLAATAFGARAGAGESALLRITEAEAVRGDWRDATPPTAGWQRVAIPDTWEQRWPGHDGVVWYRVQWQQPPTEAVGLLLHYMIMAGEVRLNGTLLHRDESLVVPVTRAWNTPRYWLLAPPLLREGTNTLLLRVSGAAAHQSGMGPVVVGPPDPVKRLYDKEKLLRLDLQLVSLSVGVTITAFFAVLWLLRRQETVYGWFALMEGTWMTAGANQVATSAWPLPSNDSWHALNSIAILFFAAAFAIFILRFSGRRMPRPERTLWTFTALGCAWMALVPLAWLYPSRSLLMLASALIAWGACLYFAITGWRSGQPDQRVLALCTSTLIAFSAHDLLVFLQVIDSNIYYASMATNIMMVGMAVVLAWRFVHNLRRIENFNFELQARVEAARAELSATLHKQHLLEVSHARLSERVNLARDLHDGLGSTLVGSIAALEHEPDKATPPMLLGVLKGLRDDLRLIVDTAAAAQPGAPGHDLLDLLAPLRRRFGQLLEASGIECRWSAQRLEGIRLPHAQGLDLLRFLQEALTNVLKHSRANGVDVRVSRHEGRLEIEVVDDGVGLPQVAPTAAGIGLRSMQARAQRLGGQLEIGSREGRTRVWLALAVPASLPAA